ncbi:MAG: gpW family head-tail joining protein [Syntrophus sp. (in: bacteria)]
MAFTSTDLTNVQTAIIALAMGARTVSLTMGDKSIAYGQAQLGELRALRDEIIAEVGSAGGRSQFVLAQTEKGL